MPRAAVPISRVGHPWLVPERRVQRRQRIEVAAVIGPADRRVLYWSWDQRLAHVAHQDRPAVLVTGAGDDRMDDLRRQPVEQPARPDQHLPAQLISGGAHDPVARRRAQLDDEARSLPIIRLDRQKTAPRG